MVDPPTFSASPSLRLLCSTVSRLVPGFRSDPDFYHAMIGGKINKFTRLLELRDYGVLAGSAREAISNLSGRSNGRNGAGTGGTTSSAPAEDWDMLQFVAYSRLFARYEPRPLDVPVVYFAASHSGRGWARITPNLDSSKSRRAMMVAGRTSEPGQALCATTLTHSAPTTLDYANTRRRWLRLRSTLGRAPDVRLCDDLDEQGRSALGDVAPALAPGQPSSARTTLKPMLLAEVSGVFELLAATR